MKISDWQKEVYEVAKEKGWHNPEKSFGECMIMVVTEISEAVEEYRNGNECSEIYFEDKKPQGVPAELADAVIRIFDTCEQFGIDLEWAVTLKNEYNKRRGWRHGNKKL